ncbi:MAG: radical SAM protein [Anaerolineae bacterium]|nr:radical SAM protein [Anaerolineae bacterium]
MVNPRPEPAYLALHRSGELEARVEQAAATLRDCRLCGWNCGIDRLCEAGPCHTGMAASVATSYLHMGEERPLVIGGGSGAIFFSNCVLRCQYCQTYRWNIKGQGRELTVPQIADLMLDHQRSGASNINLVTPIHVLPMILAALNIAASDGLWLPLVWNSSGYEALSALKLLNGIVDIYLPDMKYADDELAHRLSGVEDYVTVNRQAVSEMYRQVGHLQTDPSSAAYRGLLIRHLVLPGCFENTSEVLRWIAASLGPFTSLSLMDQYRPAYRARANESLGAALSPAEYQRARDFALQLGLTRLASSSATGG